MKMYYLCVKKPFNITNYRGKERLWADGLQVKVATSDGVGGEKAQCHDRFGKGRQKGRLHPEGIMAQNRYKGGNEDQTDWEASRSATT